MVVSEEVKENVPEVKEEMSLESSEPSKWQAVKKNITSTNAGLQPRPRHGHRVVSIRGGNREVMDDLMVYSTENGNWFQPSCNGEVPAGVAAHGMIADGTRIIIHGGMQEYGKQTNLMYELQASKWEWKKLNQKATKNSDIPCARMCHSFSSLGSKVVLFGGVTNRSDAPERIFKPDYLNDVYYLELKSVSGIHNWTKPECTGQEPSVRESHSAIVYKPEGRAPMLVVYGGKDAHSRLSDIFSLDTGSNTWVELKPLGIAPPPRSMHSAVLISQNRMVVLGGIMPINEDIPKLHFGDDPSGKSVWRSDSNMYILDLEADEWLEKGIQGDEPEPIPSPRSGAAATLIDSRLYLFAGKEYDKRCSNHMCFLETSVPSKPTNVRLIKGLETSIQVAWNAIKNADSYLVQLSPVGNTADPKKTEETKKTVEEPTKPNIPKETDSAKAPSVSATPSDKPIVPAIVDKVEPKTAETTSPEPGSEKPAAPSDKMDVDSPAVKDESKPSEPDKAAEPQIKPIEKPIEKPAETTEKNESCWHDVAIVKGTTYEIKHYYVQAENGEALTDEEKLFLDPNKIWKKNALQSGVMYRVRICAINSCGRSIFSDFSAYKTIVPGFPGAPSSIKVSKTDTGAALSWMPPKNTDIIEYSVYLAVKQVPTSGKTNNFIRVYLGHEPTCIVSHNQLAQAATNTESSNKPAVIFRIAAKNKKGYGPATQVRWLQDAKTKRQANSVSSNKDQVKKSKT